MVKFGDDLLSDDEEDGSDIKEEQLNLHFDLKEGKSRPIKRQWSTIAKAMQGMGIRVPEKHELEKSEKSLVHPALSDHLFLPAACSFLLGTLQFLHRTL